MSTRTGERRRSTPAALVAAVRPRQWVKNLLVFAAPAAAGVLTEPSGVAGAALAFAAMTAASSATYLLNDVRDREADGRHPTKRQRPIASGELGVGTAVVAAVLLFLGAVAGPVVAGRPALTLVVLAYVATTTSYSLGLKRVRMLELVLVATGFVLRAIAGAAAVDVPVSEWFLIVVSGAAIHLVASKRYAELRDHPAEARRSVLADYTPDVLLEVRHSAVAVALVGYLLWAFDIDAGRGVPWHPLSAIPFALALFEYAAATHDGGGEAPEEVLLTRGPIVAYGVAWALLFALGTYGVAQ